jgi:hypothetical protein
MASKKKPLSKHKGPEAEFPLGTPIQALDEKY